MQFSPARNDRRQNQPDASTFHSPRDTADRSVVFTRWGLGCEAQQHLDLHVMGSALTPRVLL